jgi:hypothetical protein
VTIPTPFIFFVTRNRTVITCHDVLLSVVLMDEDAYCEASTGKIFCRMDTVFSLKAPKIVIVSNSQKSILEALKKKENKRFSPSYEIIYNGFNA